MFFFFLYYKRFLFPQLPHFRAAHKYMFITPKQYQIALFFLSRFQRLWHKITAKETTKGNY